MTYLAKNSAHMSAGENVFYQFEVEALDIINADALRHSKIQIDVIQFTFKLYLYNLTKAQALTLWRAFNILSLTVFTIRHVCKHVSYDSHLLLIGLMIMIYGRHSRICLIIFTIQNYYPLLVTKHSFLRFLHCIKKRIEFLQWNENQFGLGFYTTHQNITVTFDVRDSVKRVNQNISQNIMVNWIGETLVFQLPFMSSTLIFFCFHFID